MGIAKEKDEQTVGLTYSSHGVDAVNIVVGPAGGQLVGVLLFLFMDTQTHSVKHTCTDSNISIHCMIGICSAMAIFS